MWTTVTIVSASFVILAVIVYAAVYAGNRVIRWDKNDALHATQIHTLQEEVAALSLRSQSCDTKELLRSLQEVDQKDDKGSYGKWLGEQIVKQISRNSELQKLLQKKCDQNLLDDVEKLIGDHIQKYDADKIAEADYALQSLGGKVVATSATKNPGQTVELTLLGIPIYSFKNGPETILQPSTEPGHCWAFTGSEALLIIKLAGLVEISGFSLEHIPRSLSPTGSIDSAPKSFKVWGLKGQGDRNGVCLGTYSYSRDGPPLQRFNVQTPSPVAFEYIKLHILNNQGHKEYTCLYRFRVHGKLAATKKSTT